MFTAKDNCGNTATTSAQLCITGGNLSHTKKASNTSVTCSSTVRSSFTAWLNNHGGATATDNCSSITWTNNSSGTPSYCGAVTVVFTARDNCGGSATTSAQFSVTNTTPPVLTCPSDATLPCGSAVRFGTVTATENCGPAPTVTILYTDSTTNSDGSITYKREWKATDVCGKIDTCGQVITTLSCDQSTTKKDDQLDAQEGNTGDGDELIKFIAYPNPAHDYVVFSMTFSDDQQNVSLEIYNEIGQKISTVFHGNMNKGQEYKVEFETGTLATGTYYYRLNTATKSIVEKLSIAR